MVDRQPFSPDDFWRMRFLTDMRLSPDGRFVAYTVESNDREANERRSALWLYDRERGETRQFTSGQKRDHSPRWAPDGRHIVFVSARDGLGPQLWVMPSDGGEPRQLTHMKHGASDPFWAADSSWVGFESEVRPGDPAVPLELADETERKHEEKDDAERPRVITRLQYRWDGKGNVEGRTQLFRVPLTEGAAAEPLTVGDYDSVDGACSPDGRYLAFMSDRSDERDANMTTDLWLLELESRSLRQLTDGHVAISRFSWSSDSGRIAVLAEPEIRDHSTYNTALLVVDLEASETRSLLEGQDINADIGLYNDIPSPALSAPLWSANGETLTFLSQRRGGVDVLRVAANGGEPEILVDGGETHFTQIALTPDDARLLALRAAPTMPWNLWEFPVGSDAQGEPQQLTALNADLLTERVVTAPQRFTYPSFDGTEIEGWLYPPVQRGDEPEDYRAPLVLLIHGGPHGAYGQSFYFQVQILTGKGYAVFYANPRGSTGYGERFAQACDHDWGGGDYRDLMAGVDAALTRGNFDKEQLIVTGGSYGGYMTNWIVGQTDRFKAAVTLNSVTNLLTSFGTGDIDSVWAQGDYGWPWEREGFYRERSPLTYAGQVTTPIRIIAAENDYRCPISQSEEWYTWLKKLGRAPVDFVRLPNASHGAFASPRQRIRRLELVIEWIERWVPIR